MNQKKFERVPTCGENDVDLRIAPSARRAADRSASAAPQPVDAAQAVPECAMCDDKGAVGNAPDEFQECPDCIAARAAAPRSITGAMLSAAGRALADRSAAACNVNKDDNWMVYGNDFIDDAEAALTAAGLTITKDAP